VCHLGRQAGEALEIVHHDVRRRALDERAAIAEPGAMRRQRRETPVGVLERAHLLLAHDPAQELRRVAAAGEELGVGAAVGDAGQDPLVGDDLAHRVAVHVRRLGVEDGPEVVGHGDVEHRIDGVLAGPLCRLGDGQVLEGPGLRGEGLEDGDLRDRDGDDPGLVAAQPRPARRIRQLPLALGGGAQGHIDPRRVVVEEVPVLEREREGGGGGDPLAVDPQAALPARVEPRDEHPVCVGMAHERLHDVVEQRPAAHLRQLLEVHEVVRAVHRRERHLHEALVALGEHLRQLERRLVPHDVGDHRTAVVVALHGPRAIRMEALRRPAAAPRVHRFVQQAAQLAMLGLRGHLAGLGALEAQHPDQERSHRNVGQHVHGLRAAVDAVEELGIGDPVPRQPAPHRLVRDRLDPGHGEHRTLTHLRSHRREAEAAVPDHHRRHPVPAGERQVRIPEQLRIVVRVEIDEAGRDDHPARVEHPGGVGGS
jgi:hypothetical protein